MTNSQNPTSQYRTFDAMTEDPAWKGWGYLHGRMNELAEWPGMTAAADAEVLAWASDNGWSDADLFAWANSKNGRWFADAITDPCYRHLHRATLMALPEAD